jgi:beta-galactosidase
MFFFGVDYYPEHWPEERWPVDARLMAEAGFNVVRLAEFAWSKMEPVEGSFDFGWLDRAVGTLQSYGLKVVLGTPTASPPPWLMSKNPELFRVRQDGVRLTYGNRREYCPNHPLYHDHIRSIVSAMAEHYAGHPAVIGWQIDNEFGEPCYCSVCAQAFRAWLQNRYTTTGELNRKWGTIFWSHVYNDWSEVPVPSATGGAPNPGLALDFARFVSDSYVACQQLQIDLLRQKCLGHFITHNLMGFGFDCLNYFDLVRELDLVSWDNYPCTQWGTEAAHDPSLTALNHAAMRGLKQKNFWVMEQQAGPGGWEMLGPMPRPGQLRLWAYQSIAHGADGVVFFRWRTSRFGIEQFWHGLLDYSANPSRRYQEIKRMGEELKAVGDHIAGSTVKSQVAMILSYESRFAFQVQPNNPHFSYAEHFQQIYRPFFQRHISIDVVSPETDLSGYKLVIAPALYVLPKAVAESLERYVQAGGMLVLTQRSGVKDESNAIVNLAFPGLLRELCGMEVEEVDSLSAGSKNQIKFTHPGLGHTRPEVGVLCEVLRPVGAKVLAEYCGDFYADRAAITQNAFGAGQVVYIGAVGEVELYDALAGWLQGVAGLEPVIAAQDNLEVTERQQRNRRLLFVLNHGEIEQTLKLDGNYINLLGGALLQGSVTIGPREVLLLQEHTEKSSRPEPKGR